MAVERKLGATGIAVFPIGFGVMPLSTSGRPNEGTAFGVIAAALECGVTLFDTANAYCLSDRETGHNERLIAKALKQFNARDRITVATKGGHVRPGGAWVTDGRPERLRRACERSLRDLDVETITLYQFHRPDPKVPFAESVGELARLREEGKILHLGLSNVSAAQLREAQGIVPIASVQNRLNPFDRDDLAKGTVQACAEAGVAYIPYSPVGGGWGHKRLGRQRLLVELGRKYGASPYAVALAWLLGLGEHVIPIPGASRVASIRDSAAAAGLELAPQDARRIEGM
jgi:aryl-alcohol dehydrogenase-like predicted oxidoreductase